LEQINLQRRNVLKWIGTTLGISLFGPFNFFKSGSFVSDAFAKGEVGRGGFSQFLEVSSQLLGISVSELDRDAAQIYWKGLVSLPRAQEQLKELQRVISKLNKPIKSQEELPSPLRPFARHLILTWYTGVIETPSGNRSRLFYGPSLMFAFFLKDRPAPGACAGSFGSWTKSPYS